ncbi:hypothetical protein MMC06_004257, partial [Schaereria dolodes]|nr:hypothetical protein [Schaereria dolodes]
PEVPPLFVGLNGVQGVGKTTLVTAISRTLSNPPYSLATAIFSIDDLYLPRSQQAALASSHPANPIVQHRGQPSTHDIPLGISVFSSLGSGSFTKIPQYDKSAFNGHGDRLNEKDWKGVNNYGEDRVKIVVFEGWCVGFRALGKEGVRTKWEVAVERKDRGDYRGRLGYLELEHLEFVDNALGAYDELTDRLNAFIHIDAEDTLYVYQWRLEQEIALRAAKGAGMTDEQVVSFVDGYYPAYELYSDRLRAGIFKEESGRQLRLIVGHDRRVKHVMKI